MVNNTTSGCRNCMVLIRFLVLQGLKHNVVIKVKYVRSKDNARADTISRRKFQLFHKLTNFTADKIPLPIPEVYGRCLRFGFNKTLKLYNNFISFSDSLRRAVRRTSQYGSSLCDTSRISVQQMNLIIDKLRSLSNRDTTKNNYLGIWRHLNRFVMRLDNPPDSWEERTILFCAHLIEEGRQSATIQSYVSAIKYML